MPSEERDSSRPVILGRIAPPRAIPPRRGGGGRARFVDPDARARRIDAQFEAAMAAIGDQVRISDSILAADPQLVLVFEALDEQIDLANVADKLGIEVLLEAEDAVLPTDDIRLTSDKPRNPFVASCLHAVCMNQSAFEKLLSLWRAWRDSRELPRGYSPLRELFAHLKEVRPWGPQDRLQTIDWDEYFEGRVDDRLHPIEVELWYRRSPAARDKSQREVAALVEQAGGRVSVTVTRGDGQRTGYVPVEVAMSDEELRAQVFRQAAAGLDGWRRRLSAFREAEHAVALIASAISMLGDDDSAA